MTPIGFMLSFSSRRTLVWADIKDAARIVKTASQKEEKENAADFNKKDFQQIKDIEALFLRQGVVMWRGYHG